MLLGGTTDALEINTTGTADIHWTCSYVDVDVSGVPVPSGAGEGEGTISSATDAEVAAAPGANKVRRVQLLTAVNAHASASNTITVRKNVSGTRRKAFPSVTLRAGEMLQFTDVGGFKVFDSAGRELVRHLFYYDRGILQPALMMSANITTAKTITSGSTFAIYVGRAPKPITSLQVRLQVTTAAATITWAEIGIAKGAINPGGNPTLTPVGHADVAAVVNSTGRKTVTINVAAGQVINEGDDLWILIGNQATTALQVRGLSIVDDNQLGVQGAVATRPSTTIGTNVVYTAETAVAGAWVQAVNY